MAETEIKKDVKTSNKKTATSKEKESASTAK